jgi:hypothetical protein
MAAGELAADEPARDPADAPLRWLEAVAAKQPSWLDCA